MIVATPPIAILTNPTFGANHNVPWPTESIENGIPLKFERRTDTFSLHAWL
jgi:hypothetical protein